MATARMPSEALFGRSLISEGGEPLRPGGLALTERLIDAAHFRVGDLVVDVGCGKGASIDLMLRRGLTPVGVDTSAESLDIARERSSRAAYVLSGGDDLPMRSDTVDGILSECSLSLMADRRRALGDWFRVLRGGGVLAVSDVYLREGEDETHGEGSAGPFAGISRIFADVMAAGFRLLRFEDCSDLLRGWAARFIFEHGSLEALWAGEACPLGESGGRLPGYFLLVAQKPKAGPAARRRESVL